MLARDIVNSTTIGAMGTILVSGTVVKVGTAGGETEIGPAQRFEQLVADLEVLSRAGDIGEIWKEYEGGPADTSVVRVRFKRLR
ncbi:hypothetical protein [Chitinimonas sp.]|uniref:hypothetical protein n=1 Tax=Chitinimonas sp. TaxID=1934313 RepID=UPI002F922249